jgi:hypothetical protein
MRFFGTGHSEAGRSGTGCLWITVAILIGVAVCLSPCRVLADWSYEYQDDFSDSKAEEDSYLHSIIWPQGAFPPMKPYLYYMDNLASGQRELGLGDYHGQPARLAYCFPLSQIQPRMAINGYLQVDVRYTYDAELSPSLSGYLRYSLSGDGITWSALRELGQGSYNIPLESVRGTCYVIFYGTEVLIDNLSVRLYSSSATIRVPSGFSTIQGAINSASNGDIIEVAPGTYRGAGNRDIDFQGKAITVRSQAGPEQTIIDCGGEGHRGFYFHLAEGPSSVLRGFTITNARVTGSEVGGGIYCESSSPTIVDCVIKQCTAALGGGIGSSGGEPTIFDCIIEDCYADSTRVRAESGNGAGIGLIGGSDTAIIGCNIQNNVGLGHGAGVYCWQSKAQLSNCDISYNHPVAEATNFRGGGIFCGGSSSQLTLEGCIISNNTADTGSGIFIGPLANAQQDSSIEHVRITNCTVANNILSGASVGGIYAVNSDIEISNSIVWYNDGTDVLLDDPTSSSPVLYSNTEQLFPGPGNMSSPPLFASAGIDYHLQSIMGRFDPSHGEWVIDSSHSPCIDAGDSQDSVGAEPYPNGGRINMGAFGGTRQASLSIGPLMFHVDCSSGSDFNSGTSRSDAFATIQRAVDEAISGDTIVVWPGTYQEEVTFNRKAVTLQSADDAAMIIAPNGYAFSFHGAESSMSVLRNFVIIGCGDGGVFCFGASPKLTNLTIADNQYGIVAYDGADPTITNCILWNNENGDLFQCCALYSCIEVATGVNAIGRDNGNISADPLFADSANGDYHLQSRYGRFLPGENVWVKDSLSSPCIDAGDPGVYPGRERMPHGGRVNIGAYGGTPFASQSASILWDVNIGN